MLQLSMKLNKPLFLISSALISWLTNLSSSWCILLWLGSNVITYAEGWCRASYSLCIQNLNPKWEKLCTSGKKEALAIVFGGRKFHQYIYERIFTLVTDNKPLLTILGPKIGIPSLVTARMQRWSFLLSVFQYDIIFKGELHLKPPKFKHIFVAIINSSSFLLYRYVWYWLVVYCVCFKMICEISL